MAEFANQQPVQPRISDPSEPGNMSYNSPSVRDNDQFNNSRGGRQHDASFNDRDGHIQMTNFDATNKSRDSRGAQSQRSVGSRSRARDHSRPDVQEKVKLKQPEKVAAVRASQSRIIYLNALTVFLTVIFLQVMMFIFNAVPMTNGILMSTGSSITYFVMSIVTLIFLYECHEAASYMLLHYQAFLLWFYGFVILLLGILCAAIDVGGAAAAADEMWATLSTNQKDYFKTPAAQGEAAAKTALANQRSNNTLCAAMFAITIGVLIVIQGVMVFLLRRARDELIDSNTEWAPTEMKSRAIHKVNSHEKCEFRYIQKFEDRHLKILGLEKKKKKKQQIAGMDVSDEEEHDEYSFNEDEEDMDYSIRSDYDQHAGGMHGVDDMYGGDGLGGTVKESQMSGDESERSRGGGGGRNNSSRRAGGSMRRGGPY